MKKLLPWVLRLVPAIILLQTLTFKFTAHPDSVALFAQLGVEPFGRIGIGVFELIAGILLLIPATSRFGAFLAVGLMLGAVASHLFVLGISYNGDGGALFGMALITLIAAALIVYRERTQLITDLNGLLGRKAVVAAK
ncbi:MAG: DoxX family protein [Bacteroidota bacterium]